MCFLSRLCRGIAQCMKGWVGPCSVGLKQDPSCHIPSCVWHSLDPSLLSARSYFAGRIPIAFMWEDDWSKCVRR